MVVIVRLFKADGGRPRFRTARKRRATRSFSTADTGGISMQIALSLPSYASGSDGRDQKGAPGELRTPEELEPLTETLLRCGGLAWENIVELMAFNNYAIPFAGSSLYTVTGPVPSDCLQGARARLVAFGDRATGAANRPRVCDRAGAARYPARRLTWGIHQASTEHQANLIVWVEFRHSSDVTSDRLPV